MLLLYAIWHVNQVVKTSIRIGKAKVSSTPVYGLYKLTLQLVSAFLPLLQTWWGEAGATLATVQTLACASLKKMMNPMRGLYNTILAKTESDSGSSRTI